MCHHVLTIWEEVYRSCTRSTEVKYYSICMFYELDEIIFIRYNFMAISNV